MKKVLIIGASGFIGYNLSNYLISKNSFRVTTITRRNKTNFKKKPFKNYVIPDLYTFKNWKSIINNNEIIIISFGLAHKNFVSFNSYKKINTQLPEKIIKQCLKNKVKKIIFLSSVSVYGDNSNQFGNLTENSKCNPSSKYGKSKLIAENTLIKLCEGKIKYFILRPPMVYGYPLRGNFKILLKLINLQIPLPFKNIKTKRSYIYIKNLIHFIYICTLNKSKSGVYLVSDNDDVSINKFVNEIGKAHRNKIRKFKPGKYLIKILLTFPIISNLFNKINDPFRLDITQAKNIMNYQPIYNIESAIKDMYKKN